ncbi:MAG: enoyl-CoA hydratase/isomerase family protein [Bacillaceae bacterium]|nr:enoyl-CoA hydratase/isomerase family protein [Bacillaceae bacterium]
MKTLSLEVHEGVLRITFNRPDVRNALSLEMIDELNEVLDRYRFDASVKVLVFTGAGDKAFMAGGDLQQFMSARNKKESYPVLKKVSRLLQNIADYPKPTVAMINGVVLGGGAEFATACDFRFASDRAKIGFVQIGMHIITGWGGGSRLIRKLGSSRALSLLLTGDLMAASRAAELGFVNEIFEHERLEDEVMSFCQRIARHDTASIKGFKELARLYENGTDLDVSIERELDICSDLWGSEAHYSVVRPFVEKNKSS